MKARHLSKWILSKNLNKRNWFNFIDFIDDIYPIHTEDLEILDMKWVHLLWTLLKIITIYYMVNTVLKIIGMLN